MSENIPRTRYPSERLSDLSNSQANKMLKECYGLLEHCECDEDFHLLGQVMKINDELFHDIIELMKLKGWLTIE